MVSIEEARAAATRARAILQERRTQASDVLQRLKEARESLPSRTSQMALRQNGTGLQGREFRRTIQRAEEEITTRQKGVQSFRESLQSFEGSIQESEREIEDFVQAQARAQAQREALKQAIKLAPRIEIPLRNIEEGLVRDFTREIRDQGQIFAVRQEALIASPELLAAELTKLQARGLSQERALAKLGLQIEIPEVPTPQVRARDGIMLPSVIEEPTPEPTFLQQVGRGFLDPSRVGIDITPQPPSILGFDITPTGLTPSKPDVPTADIKRLLRERGGFVGEVVAFPIPETPLGVASVVGAGGLIVLAPPIVGASISTLAAASGFRGALDPELTPAERTASALIGTLGAAGTTATATPFIRGQFGRLSSDFVPVRTDPRGFRFVDVPTEKGGIIGLIERGRGTGISARLPEISPLRRGGFTVSQSEKKLFLGKDQQLATSQQSLFKQGQDLKIEREFFVTPEETFLNIAETRISRLGLIQLLESPKGSVKIGFGIPKQPQIGVARGDVGRTETQTRLRIGTGTELEAIKSFGTIGDVQKVATTSIQGQRVDIFAFRFKPHEGQAGKFPTTDPIRSADPLRSTERGTRVQAEALISGVLASPKTTPLTTRTTPPIVSTATIPITPRTTIPRPLTTLLSTTGRSLITGDLISPTPPTTFLTPPRPTPPIPPTLPPTTPPRPPPTPPVSPPIPPKTPPTPPISPPISPPIVPPTPPVSPPLELGGSKRRMIQEAEGLLFEAVSRRFGKPVSLGKFRTKGRAEDKLKTFLTDTLAASGHIKRGGRKILTNELNLFGGDRFRTAKRDPFQIVERKQFRLSQKPEVDEIQFFKKQAGRRRGRLI